MKKITMAALIVMLVLCVNRYMSMNNNPEESSTEEILQEEKYVPAEEIHAETLRMIPIAGTFIATKPVSATIDVEETSSAIEPETELETEEVIVPETTAEEVQIIDPVDEAKMNLDEINEAMVSAVMKRDEKTLKKLVAERNAIIDEFGLDDIKLTNYYELFDFCRVVSYESGDWLADEDRHIELVAAVILNRVRSSAFPDNITEVIWQKNQYATVYNDRINFYGIDYSEKVVRICIGLLDDHRICPMSVVFQANFKQGSGVYETYSPEAFKGTSYAHTYFCYDNYPDRDCYKNDPFEE